MKLRQIVDQSLHIALMDLNSKDIPMAAAHMLSNISDKVEQEVAAFNKAKYNRAKALCIKKPKPVEAPVEGQETSPAAQEAADGPVEQGAPEKKKAKAKSKGKAALEAIKGEAEEMVPDLDEKGFFKFTPENQKIIDEEVQELLEKEIEMPKIKAKHLEDIKISGTNFTFLKPLLEF